MTWNFYLTQRCSTNNWHHWSSFNLDSAQLWTIIYFHTLYSILIQILALSEHNLALTVVKLSFEQR